MSHIHKTAQTQPVSIGFAKKESRAIPDTYKKTIFISKLPSEKYDHDGVGYYSGFFIKNASNVSYTVLCQYTPDSSEEWDANEYEGQEIIRCFDSNKLITSVSIIKNMCIQRFSKGVKNMHIQYEFFSYSSPIEGALFITIISFFARILLLRSVVTLHQIPSERDIIERLGKKSIFSSIMIGGIHLVFFLLAFLNSKLVVHESIFADRLEKEYHISRKKIETIPHLSYKENIELPNSIPQKLQNIQHTELKMLFFGYLSWYKGLDTLIHNYLALPQEMQDTTSLIIAGSEHPKQKNDHSYIEWLQNLREITKDSPNIIWYGFVPQEEVGALFSFSDTLLLPYVNIFSSSGPFAWALSHHMPVMVSGAMQYLSRLGFPEYSGNDFEEKILDMIENKDTYIALAEQINEERKVENTEYKFAQIYR